MIMKFIMYILYGTLIWSGSMIAISLTFGFKNECKHIYAAVQQKEIKVTWSYPTLDVGLSTDIFIGKHEGADIVCVKCFHQTRQIIDYGNAGLFRDRIGQVELPNDTTGVPEWLER